MPFYWPTGSTAPTWVTITTPSVTAAGNWPVPATTSATATSNSIWWANNYTTAATTAGNSIVWASNQNQTYSSYQNQAQTRLLAQLCAAQVQQDIWRGLLGALAAPALITHQEQAQRDQDLYRRALAEHDDQEAARLLRQIEARELVAADRQRLIEQQAQQHREEQGRREAATIRARELLLEHLTPQQRETFVKNGWFVVEGGRTKTKYRIRGGTLTANIDVFDKQDKRIHRLCGHAQSHIPMGDQLLAQKIMLELAEDEFLRIANRHAA